MSLDDHLARAMKRVHETTLHNTTVEVYEPTASYSAGDGVDVSYPSTPTATLNARLEPPNRDTDQDAGGITETADAVLRVRDDTAVQWVDGDGGANTRVTDTETGDRYEARSVTREQNGLVRIALVEVDS